MCFTISTYLRRYTANNFPFMYSQKWLSKTHFYYQLVSLSLSFPSHPSICMDECERGGGAGWGYTGAQFSNEIYTQSKQNSVIRGPTPINLDRVPALAEGYSPLSHGSIQASDRPVIQDKWPVIQSQVVCHLGHAWLKVVVLPKTNMFFLDEKIFFQDIYILYRRNF